MRILLVDLAEQLVTAVTAALGRDHEVSVLRDACDESRCAAAAGVDVAVHEVRLLGADPLSELERVTRGTWNVLRHAKAQRYVQLSTLRLFDGYDPGWALTEEWLPRPTPDPMLLVPYLAELAARELARALPVRCLTLRLDTPADAAPAAVAAFIAQGVVGGVAGGVTASGDDAAALPWRAVHQRPGRMQEYPRTQPRWPERPEPLSGMPVPKRIGILGAGGPLAAAAVAAFGNRHRLLLTDTRPLSTFAEAPPQSPGAPRAVPASAPHEERVVDITDLGAVRAVAASSDCIVNCAVVRDQPAAAFRVNVLGAYNTMRAAADAGLTRVVHTGPALILNSHPYGFADDRMIGPDVPPRAGAHLYFLTKLLALEICRIFAEAYRIACPALHFVQFVNPAVARTEQAHPFAVSWTDGGRSIVAATTVASLPRPCPVVHVLAESPHGRYDAAPGWELLGTRPLERLDHLWYQQASGTAGRQA